MNLDINTTTQTAFFLAVIGSFISFILGIRAISSGTKLMFFRKRQEFIGRGWRYIFVGLFLGASSFFLRQYAEPVIYFFFKPSMTPSLTYTVTITPSITITPTITFTPTITNTPSISPTPFLSDEIIVKFKGKITPNPEALFSKPQFAKMIDIQTHPVNPTNVFSNPVGKIFATFSYDKMVTNSQWTALWVRTADKEILCIDSKPWDGNTGGYSFSSCNPAADKWLPGTYEIQLYSGTVFKTRSYFSVKGLPPTSTPTRTSTNTPSLTFTPKPTYTPEASKTPSPTSTLKTVVSPTPLDLP